MSHDGVDAGHREFSDGHREDGEDAGDDADGANICCASKTLHSVMIKSVKDLLMMNFSFQVFLVDVNALLYGSILCQKLSVNSAELSCETYCCNLSICDLISARNDTVPLFVVHILSAPQCGAHSRGACRDFQPNPIHPSIHPTQSHL